MGNKYYGIVILKTANFLTDWNGNALRFVDKEHAQKYIDSECKEHPERYMPCEYVIKRSFADYDLIKVI